MPKMAQSIFLMGHQDLDLRLGSDGLKDLVSDLDRKDSDSDGVDSTPTLIMR